MRLLARWTLNALTALSLLLCLATVGLWVRSAHRWDALLWVTPRGHLAITTAWGKVILQKGRVYEAEKDVLHSGYQAGRFPRQLGGDSEDEREWPIWLIVRGSARTPAWLEWTGIRVDEEPHGPFDTPGFRHTQIYVPFAYAIALFFALPTAALFRSAAHKLRWHKGRCSRCSYDLTGNVSGVCPECGIVIVKETA